MTVSAADSDSYTEINISHVHVMSKHGVTSNKKHAAIDYSHERKF